MTILDLRSSWPCALCDSEAVAKRGTICPTCELRLDADHRMRHLDAQLPLDDPASMGSVIAFRGVEDVPTGDLF